MIGFFSLWRRIVFCEYETQKLFDGKFLESW